MRLCLWFLGAFLLSTAIVPPSLNAQLSKENSASHENTSEPGMDSFILTGGWNHISGQANGGEESFDWVHSAPSARTLTLGMASYQWTGSHWTFGRAGLYVPWAGRWGIETQMNLGGGSASHSGFIYERFLVGINYHVAPRLYVSGQEEFLSIANSHGHLAGVATYLIPAKWVSADLSYKHSIGGNLATSFVSSRLDFHVGKVQPFGGFAVGNAAPEVFNLGAGEEALARNLRECFVGAVVPVSTAQFNVAIDRTDIGGIQTYALTVALRFEINKRRRVDSNP